MGWSGYLCGCSEKRVEWGDGGDRITLCEKHEAAYLLWKATGQVVDLGTFPVVNMEKDGEAAYLAACWPRRNEVPE